MMARPPPSNRLKSSDDGEAAALQQAEILGLVPHLDYIVGYDSGHGRKPHPGMSPPSSPASGMNRTKSPLSATRPMISTPPARLVPSELPS